MENIMFVVIIFIVEFEFKMREILYLGILPSSSLKGTLHLCLFLQILINRFLC